MALMLMHKYNKSSPPRSGNPFQSLEKTSVLQEARTFNDTPVNAKKCIHILTKILYLLNQGEQLGTREATECFFAMTKLFQSKDTVLRRMVYLGIKELSTIAEDVIIVTSSLTKDMTVVRIFIVHQQFVHFVQSPIQVCFKPLNVI
jgi:coatomer protein complex subunit gamma